MATPNSYAGSAGAKVHSTSWVWASSTLVAYPACNAERQLVPPGRWTYDPVTCSRCRKHRLRANASENTHELIRLRMRLWTEIVNAIGVFGQDIFRLGVSKDPGRRARLALMVTISDDFTAFLDQCVDEESYRVLMLVVAEHRQTIFGVLCEDLADGRAAAEMGGREAR